jgi:hypothetical protein
MATPGALEDQELMSEGKNLNLQRCSSLKGLPNRRKQRENDREHVVEKLQRRLPKFNQFSQNGVFGKHRTATATCPVSLFIKQTISIVPTIPYPKDVIAPSSNALRLFLWDLGAFFACL